MLVSVPENNLIGMQLRDFEMSHGKRCPVASGTGGPSFPHHPTVLHTICATDTQQS